MNIRDDVVLGQHSHVGMARTENQDFFGYFEPDDDREFDLKGRLVIVCDGMGGHAGGEIASRLAVQTVIDTYKKDTTGNVEEALRSAIEAANAAIQKEAQKEQKLMGMGSTCTALVHRRDMVYFGQVGDSRGYLIRNGKIKQMTKDHSLVQELVDQGLIDKTEMESHPDKNVILRSLGVKPTVDVDVSYVPATVNDIYLICSDGLSGPVSDQEMLSIVQASNGDLRSATERLIELANRYGGFDNITVQCLKVLKTDTATTDKTDQKTVTASFTPDQVQASIEKAKAEAAAKGKAPRPDKVPATKGSMPAAPATPATAAPRPAKPAGSSSGAKLAPPPAAAGVPAAHSGGGAGKLFAGLVVGALLGAVLVFVLAKTGRIKGPSGPSGFGDAVDKAWKGLDAAKQDMQRAKADTLAPDAWKEADALVTACPPSGETPERLSALVAATNACTKAANAARAAYRDQQARDARAAAEAAEKKAKKTAPAYEWASVQYKAGQKAQEENDPATALGHYIAAKALFEFAAK